MIGAAAQPLRSRKRCKQGCLHQAKQHHEYETRNMNPALSASILSRTAINTPYSASVIYLFANENSFFVASEYLITYK